MKPCRDIDKIIDLMRYHQEEAEAHRQMIDFHTDRVDRLHKYARELMRPGFKVNKDWIVI